MVILTTNQIKTGYTDQKLDKNRLYRPQTDKKGDHKQDKNGYTDHKQNKNLIYKPLAR